MRSLIICCILSCLTVVVSAQTEPVAAQASPTAIPQNNIKVEINTSNGEVKLIDAKGNLIQNSTQFNVKEFQVIILSEKGEYAGTLELNELKFPSEELNPNEQVKISKIELTHKESGIAYQPVNIKIIRN